MFMNDHDPDDDDIGDDGDDDDALMVEVMTFVIILRFT